MARVMLTFDDGPDPVWTPRLLDLLAAERIRASFFVIAPRAAAHPDLIARTLADGHQVGLHCDEHARHSERSLEWCREDTERALSRLTDVGVRPGLWRTPYGDTAPWSEQIAAEHGLRITPWTVDTHDWRGDTAQAMFGATVDGLRDGAIVLAHDGIGPGARRDDARETLAYVARVAVHARDHGLELAALA